MRTKLVMLSLLLAASACKDDAPPAASGPTPVPERSHAPIAPAPSEADETGEAARVLDERPPADPAIERALGLIRASGLRFLDLPRETDKAPTEYTAEQFAVMLRTKWDWVGYDLTELKPWLDEIATRSFKTNLPYQVVLPDGTTSELRSWLDAELAKQPPPP